MSVAQLSYRLLNVSWLAQLVERRNVGWEVEGSSPGRTNTQGPKITEENVLPF